MSVDRELKKTCLDVAEIIREHAIDAAPKRTRKLVESITTMDHPEGAAVGAQVEYARTVHEGTPLPGPHEIKPRRKKALKFTTPDGREVIVKKVRHPGAKRFKTTPFFRIALQRGADEISRVLKKRMGEAAAQEFHRALKSAGLKPERVR